MIDIRDIPMAVLINFYDAQVGGSRVHAFEACTRHQGALRLEEPIEHAFGTGLEQQVC